MMKLSMLTPSLFILLCFNLLLAFNTQAFDHRELTQTLNLVKANDKFVTLLGTQVAIDDVAPNFKVVDGNFAPVQLSDFKNKTVLISVVPSLDTGVCSIQTKRFNDEAANLPTDIIMLTLSNDLPFAQKRFCKIENIDKIKVLSDAVWHDFGEKYGVLIKNMGLLTRAIFIIDQQGKLAYKELVADIAQHPDYPKALAAAIAIAKPIEHMGAADKNIENTPTIETNKSTKPATIGHKKNDNSPHVNSQGAKSQENNDQPNNNKPVSGSTN